MNPFLTYRFQGCKFEFIQDYVQVTDERYYPNKVWKISITSDDKNPFVLQLLGRK